MLSTILRLVYPSLCRNCSSIIDQGQSFCFLCQNKIKPVVPVFLPLTKKYVINVYAACAYKDPVKTLVFKKFSYDTLACKQLANLMIDFVPFNVIEPDILIPVPLHWTRYAWRGYNQAELMATHLGKRLDVPVINLVKRKHRTAFQSKLDAQQRKKNVENVFAVKQKFVSCNPIKDKNVVIIDDLFTTGSTIRGVAKQIAELQPMSITVAVACRAV